MKLSHRLLTFVLVLALASLSCSFSIDTGEVAASAVPPAVIIVPITVTSAAPVQQPPAAATSASQQPAPQLPPPPTALPTATATQGTLHFYVSGYIWHDTCTQVDGPVPNPLPAGCLFDAVNGMYADGIRQAGEPGIAGVIVRLEIACSYGAFTVSTDSNGFYSMSFTVPANAGISQQLICLSVDATSSSNSNVLIPGGWTAPHVNSAVATRQLTIPVETQNTVNFGWDFQF